jgi:hypothetical protein
MRQSSISYFADMLLCPLLAAGLAIFASARFAKLALVEWSVMVIAGVVLWTLVEYAMHREFNSAMTRSDLGDPAAFAAVARSA